MFRLVSSSSHDAHIKHKSNTSGTQVFVITEDLMSVCYEHDERKTNHES